MFQFPGFPRYNYWFIISYRNITRDEFPHSDIRDYYRLCATRHGFSQLVTSFFGAIYQGILPTLFVAYSYLHKFSSLILLLALKKIQKQTVLSLTSLYILSY